MGREHLLDFESPDALGAIRGNIDGWLILAHLGGVPFEAVNVDDEADSQRIDPVILGKRGDLQLPLATPDE